MKSVTCSSYKNYLL